MMSEPPYDGKPCIACPIEVRALTSTVHNMLHAYDAWQDDVGSFERFKRKIGELRESYEPIKAIVDEHFSNPAHSHGT